MAYVYMQYEIDPNGLGRKKPFYIGISYSDVVEHNEPTGQTPNEIIENFINEPYIRMYDFGPKSMHGFKAKLSFEDGGEKSEEYQEFIKDKVWKVDYDAEVVFETANIQTINYIEFLLVKKYGFIHEGGLLYNKIPGGCKLVGGKLVYQFDFNYLMDCLIDGSLSYNPNWCFINKEKGYKIAGDLICEKGLHTDGDIDYYKKRIEKLEKKLEQK